MTDRVPATQPCTACSVLMLASASPPRSHSAGKETEAQRDIMTCPGLHTSEITARTATPKSKPITPLCQVQETQIVMIIGIVVQNNPLDSDNAAITEGACFHRLHDHPSARAEGAWSFKKLLEAG